MVFVFDWWPEDNSDFDINDWLPHFSEFDDWDHAQFLALQTCNQNPRAENNRQCDSTSSKKAATTDPTGNTTVVACNANDSDDENEDGRDSKSSIKRPPLFNPTAWFSFEDDWDETDVPLEGYCAGQIVLVKFLRPRGASAERLGIVGVKFYGYKRTPRRLGDLVIDNAAPLKPMANPATRVGLHEDDAVSCEAVFMRVLGFLIDVSEDQMTVFTRFVFIIFLLIGWLLLFYCRFCVLLLYVDDDSFVFHLTGPKLPRVSAVILRLLTPPLVLLPVLWTSLI